MLRPGARVAAQVDEKGPLLIEPIPQANRLRFPCRLGTCSSVVLVCFLCFAMSTLLLIVHICQCRSIDCSLVKLNHLLDRCLSPNVLSVHWHNKNHNKAKNETEQMKKLIRTKCTTKSYLQTMGVSRRSKKHLELVFVFGQHNNWPTICGSPQVTTAAAIAATMAGPIAICVPMNYLLNWPTIDEKVLHLHGRTGSCKTHTRKPMADSFQLIRRGAF